MNTGNNTKKKWMKFYLFIKDRINWPSQHPEYVMYFIIFVIIIGWLWVWIPIWQILYSILNWKFNNILIESLILWTCTYFLALISISSVEFLIIENTDIKNSIILFWFSSSIIWIIFFLLFYLPKDFLLIRCLWSFLFFIISLFYWWIANAESTIIQPSEYSPTKSWDKSIINWSWTYN